MILFFKHCLCALTGGTEYQKRSLCGTVGSYMRAIPESCGRAILNRGLVKWIANGALRYVLGDEARLCFLLHGFYYCLRGWWVLLDHPELRGRLRGYRTVDRTRGERNVVRDHFENKAAHMGCCAMSFCHLSFLTHPIWSVSTLSIIIYFFNKHIFEVEVAVCNISTSS